MYGKYHGNLHWNLHGDLAVDFSGLSQESSWGFRCRGLLGFPPVAITVGFHRHL
jgi:hypothetical protein